MAREFAPKRQPIHGEPPVIGYSQRCAVCGCRFTSKRPAATCSSSCRAIRWQRQHPERTAETARRTRERRQAKTS